MPNRFDERSANYVMALINKGESVPLGVQNAAARIQLGQGSDRDAKTVNNYLGNKSHGARALKRFRGKIDRVVGSVSNITRDVELLDQAARSGGNTSIAQGRLINTISQEFDKLTKSKFVRGLAGDVAEALGKNRIAATRFLKFLGGAARLGGGVAAVVQAGFSVAEKYYATGRSVAESVGRQLDTTRRLQIDPRTGARIDSEAARNARRSVGEVRTRLSRLGFSDAEQKAAEAESTERKATIAAFRNNLGALGRNVSEEALAKMAVERGKTINELTSAERAEALDAAGKGVTDIENYANDPQVLRQLEREFGGNDQIIGRETRDFFSAISGGLIQSTDTQVAARKRELMIKRAAQVVKSLAQREQDLETSAEKMRSHRTPAESLQHRIELEQAQAEGRAYRSRHQAWSNR